MMILKSSQEIENIFENKKSTADANKHFRLHTVYIYTDRRAE